MKLLILAGGYGTRLRNILKETPKALAPIHDKPFLWYQIKNWRKQGLCEFVFLLHYGSEQIIEFINKIKKTTLKGCKIDFVIEKKPLLTGGAIGNAVQELGLEKSFLVVNADTWLGDGISLLSKKRINSLFVIMHNDIRRYGEVVFDKNFYISSLREKSSLKKSGWINTGLYKLDPRIFSTWNGDAISLEKIILPNMIKKRLIKAVPLQADFIDIGIEDDYIKFCSWQKNNRKNKL